MIIVPDSYGSLPLQEAWTPESRAGALISRRAGGAGLPKGKKEKPKAKAKVVKAAPKPGAPKKPTRDKDETDEKGDRVQHYSDGSTVTSKKDGTAVHRAADGTERKGKFTEPKPKGPPEPEGFKANTPESDARDAKRAEAEAKRVEREKHKGEKKKAPANRRYVSKVVNRFGRSRTSSTG